MSPLGHYTAETQTIGPDFPTASTFSTAVRAMQNSDAGGHRCWISFSSNLIHFLHQVMWETLTPKPTFRDGFNPTHENGDVGLEQTALGPHDPRHSAALAKEARNSQTRTARPYRINGSCEANQGCPSEGFEG